MVICDDDTFDICERLWVISESLDFLLHMHMYISSREEYVMSTCNRFYKPRKDNTETGMCSKL